MTERQEEQAALHALHLLDAHEERILESEMRTDAKLDALVPELEAVAAQVALAVPPEPPPAEARRALLAELRHRRRSNVVNLTRPLRILGSPWLAWAAAAVLLLFALHYRGQKHRLQDEMVAFKSDAVSARAEVSKVQQKLDATAKDLAAARLDATEQADKVAQLMKINALERMEAATLRHLGNKRYEEAVAVVVWDSEKQEGKLRFQKMPPVIANKDYQLWVIDKKSGTPVSAGVVKVDPKGTALMTFPPLEPVTEVAKFAVSLEAQGGAAKKSADTPIVLVSP